jgi:hypothetical protein
MASRIIELSNLVCVTIDQILTTDWDCARIEPSDEVFTELYGEFGSGSIEPGNIESVMEAIRDIRDEGTGFSGSLARSEDLEIMRSAWTRLRPRLLAYAAFTDRAARDRSRGGPGEFGDKPDPPERVQFDDAARTVVVDGFRYQVPNPDAYLAFKVVYLRKSWMTNAEIAAALGTGNEGARMDRLKKYLPPKLRAMVKPGTRGKGQQIILPKR